MSGTGNERSRTGGCGCLGGKSGGDDKEDGGGGLPIKSDDKTEQKCFRKTKKLSLFRFRKANKLHHRRRQKGTFANSEHWEGGGGGGGGGGGRCFVCMKRSMTVGSSVESPTSDPNSTEFSYDSLRALIERNDFLDEDCNTHFGDKDGSSDSSHKKGKS